jgi:hypothetical protein
VALGTFQAATDAAAPDSRTLAEQSDTAAMHVVGPQLLRMARLGISLDEVGGGEVDDASGEAGVCSGGDVDVVLQCRALTALGEAFPPAATALQRRQQRLWARKLLPALCALVTPDRPWTVKSAALVALACIASRARLTESGKATAAQHTAAAQAGEMGSAAQSGTVQVLKGGADDDADDSVPDGPRESSSERPTLTGSLIDEMLAAASEALGDSRYAQVSEHA